METPKDAGTKIYSNGPGHMTNMAATQKVQRHHDLIKAHALR